MMPAHPKPITINGVEYVSILAASRALGIPKSTLRWRFIPSTREVERRYLARPEIKRLRVQYHRRHAKTAKGRATQARYDRSAKGRARSARYATMPKRRAARARIKATATVLGVDRH